MINVLIIDDDEVIADFISECLELIELEINSDVYYCSEKALDSIDYDKYDLVFSDYEMPVFNGVKVLQAFAEKSKKFPPFSFVTGHSGNVAGKVKYGGPLLLIKKPFRYQDVEKVVLKYIR